MRPFKFTSTTTIATALQAAGNNTNANFLAGGTNILDLMKEDVARPDELIDISRLALSQIATTSGGGISLGALAKNTQTANHASVRQNFPLLTEAILAGASAQIRNMATNGGNLMQRTRCPYFYDVNMPCNKREPGTGCGAMEGFNRMHAIFGWSEKCVAVYPSDMAVALAALEATVKVQQKNGASRVIPFGEFHRLPGAHPEVDNTLKSGEIITAIEIPKNNFAGHSHYLKARDRASYAFALLSVAAALDVTDGKINQVRLALGGVAHKPWRAFAAEQFLIGKSATTVNFQQAAALEMDQAKPLEHNRFKIELGKKSIVRALEIALNGKNFNR
jgi:xanthine dehydrogenase YagS FAD-binding subunit